MWRCGYSGGNDLGFALHGSASGPCKEQAGVMAVYGIVRCLISKEYRLPTGSRMALLMTIYQESRSKMTVTGLFMVRLIAPALWPYTCSACLPRQLLPLFLP